MIAYICSPYSHPLPEVRQDRFLAAKSAVSRLLAKGVMVYSPIVFSHQFADQQGTDFEAWRKFDLAMIDRCDELWVLMIEGWRESKGVAEEIENARDRWIPQQQVKGQCATSMWMLVRYLDPITLEVTT